MKSKGYVTVFVTLMLVVMMSIAVAVILISDREGAKTKSVTALSSACSSELANYNRFIFDRYHILLLDKNASGCGEGAMEEEIETLLKTDLGKKYSIGQVELSGTVGITDNKCQEFKNQINENFTYDVIEYSVDKIIEKTSGNDEPVSKDTVSEIDKDVEEEKKKIEESTEDDEDGKGGEKKSKGKKKGSKSNKKKKSKSKDSDDETEDVDEDTDVTDPRDTLKKYVEAGVAVLLLPDSSVLGDNVIGGEEYPSYGNTKSLAASIKTEFNDLDRMEMDSTQKKGWGTSLATKAKSIVYAGKYFNSLTNQKYSDTYMNLEMEYIVAGKNTDAANYKTVVDEILLIRFGFNFAYILTDSAKMGECETLATAICAAFPAAAPVVKYLLAGCWSYIESIADVYRLVRGHKVPYVKSKSTWVTDFESLAKMDEVTEDAPDDENGLDYNEYLMILMATKGDDIYYRMLDLMQANVTHMESGDSSFRMRNAITAFSVNVDIDYKGKTFALHEEAGY